MVRLRIVLLPDRGTKGRAIRLSKELSNSLDTYFTLNSRNPIPHITIAAGDFPKKSIGAMRKGLAKIADGSKPFNVSLDRVVYYHLSIRWVCRSNKKFNLLRRRVTTLTSKYTARNMVENPLLPHITVACPRGVLRKDEVNKILGKKHGRFLGAYIALAYTSDHGIVTGVIAKYRLGAT